MLRPFWKNGDKTLGDRRGFHRIGCGGCDAAPAMTALFTTGQISNQGSHFSAAACCRAIVPPPARSQQRH